ncbi:RagB/SusD family nutrient uptake outer membrane protein [Arachidicoccus sp.]|uniref:RagB/SusD family nutrient uptake outer membrane protein n=1 Tax=Arachidicoccus sp. TaxID=1872624 RepID=UPI003D1A7DF6
MKYKKIYYASFIALLLCMGVGCKKFLNVTPQNALSGNNYWKTKNDVQSFMNGIYLQYRNATMQNKAFFTASGDFRSSRIWNLVSNTGGGNVYVNDVESNDLVAAVTHNDGRVRNIMDWTDFYKDIASCNILLKEIDKVPTNEISAQESAAFKAEAIFMRSLCYFAIVRLFGDVPYNVTAYDTSALPRTNQTVIFNNCLADLGAALPNLPWTYTDISDIASRANKGAAIDLMMNMNMWNANFDAVNNQKYWAATDSLGGLLMNDNGGAYGLLPISDFKTIFAGHSKESLFEIEQNANKQDVFYNYGQFANYVLGYKLNSQYQFVKTAPLSSPTKSRMYIDKKVLSSLYPSGNGDQRFNLWIANSTDEDGDFAFIKFSNMVYGTDQNGSAFSASTDAHVVFRLAGAILLRAEACNDLGKTADALSYLNMIEGRAGLPSYNSTSQDNIDNEIFLERTRELMGEGWSFYDLVRTKKILDPGYSNAMPSSDYANGAWTWPISNSALTNNPNMVLNTFWNVSY